MEKKSLPLNKEIEIVDIEKTKGTMKNEETGATFDWTSTTIKFKVDGYPVVFKAKLDKMGNEYIEEALGEDEGF